MDNLFRQIGIYAPDGQLNEPEDAGSMMYYKEAANRQLLEEGICEAGALSSWAAAATSYSIHGMQMLPIYIYHSMFGFPRVGDLIWAAAVNAPVASCWGQLQGVRSCLAKVCNIRMAPPTSSPPLSQTAAATIQPLPMNWR